MTRRSSAAQAPRASDGVRAAAAATARVALPVKSARERQAVRCSHIACANSGSTSSSTQVWVRDEVRQRLKSEAQRGGSRPSTRDSWLRAAARCSQASTAALRALMACACGWVGGWVGGKSRRAAGQCVFLQLTFVVSGVCGCSSKNRSPPTIVSVWLAASQDLQVSGKAPKRSRAGSRASTRCANPASKSAHATSPPPPARRPRRSPPRPLIGMDASAPVVVAGPALDRRSSRALLQAVAPRH